MNYKIKECEILICNKHYPALVEAIQNEYPHFPKNTESIIRIFEWFNFRIDVNFQGDIFGLELTDESREEDEALFNTMAPFVEPGSYIGFVNHAGDTWRCVFDGGESREDYSVHSLAGSTNSQRRRNFQCFLFYTGQNFGFGRV